MSVGRGVLDEFLFHVNMFISMRFIQHSCFPSLAEVNGLMSRKSSWKKQNCWSSCPSAHHVVHSVGWTSLIEGEH